MDLQGFQLSKSSPQRSADETLVLLADELDAYEPTLLASRRALIAANKIDMVDAGAALRTLNQRVDGLVRDGRFRLRPSIYPISALRGDGLGELAMALRRAVDAAKQDQLQNPSESSQYQSYFDAQLHHDDIETVRFHRERAKQVYGKIW